MNCSVVYVSKTGNTEKIAQAVRDELGAACRYFGEPSEEAAKADLIFAGFWTDKGSCGPQLESFLKSLAGKTIAPFGTAGFGGSSEYFTRILTGVAGKIPVGNRIEPGFMCQGKMPLSVRDRYEKMGNAQAIKNFDEALSHPDETDLLCAKKWARGVADRFTNAENA